jgi:hypothetical protein
MPLDGGSGPIWLHRSSRQSGFCPVRQQRVRVAVTFDSSSAVTARDAGVLYLGLFAMRQPGGVAEDTSPASGTLLAEIVVDPRRTGSG